MSKRQLDSKLSRARRANTRTRRCQFEQLESRTVLSTLSYFVVADEQRGLPADLAEQVHSAGGTVRQVLPEIGIAIVTTDDPGFAERAAGFGGSVQAVAPNVPFPMSRAASPPVTLAYSADDMPAPSMTADPDPLSALQWGLDAIDAPEAWALGATGQVVRVAVLDTGIVSDHLGRHGGLADNHHGRPDDHAAVSQRTGTAAPQAARPAEIERVLSRFTSDRADSAVRRYGSSDLLDHLAAGTGGGSLVDQALGQLL